MIQLSNGRPFDLFAVYPHCLDNEYWPAEDMAAVLGRDASRAELERRNQAVHREFIRSLVYSPQVFIGRQSATSAEPLIQAAKEHPEALAQLMNDGRLILLLMEDSFEGFLKEPPFAIDPRGQRLWLDFLEVHGEPSICSLRLAERAQTEVRKRYSSFFRELRVEEPEDRDNYAVLFAECSGRELSDLVEPAIQAEFEDFCELISGDLNQWANHVTWKEFRRSRIYDRYVWLKDVSGDTATQERRIRHRLTMKRLADLAYNHNTPVAVGRQSFTPPGTPDPTALPPHLYKPLQYPDVDAVSRGAASQKVFSELLEARADAQQHFFYRMQQDMILPDIGSFTVADVCEIHGWSEWKFFNAAQEAAMRFSDAQELQRQLERLFEANVELHKRLEHEMRRKTWWHQAIHGALDLGLAVTAYVGCEALLPAHALSGVQPALAALAGGVTHKTVEAGIDLCIVGVEQVTRKVVNKIGGRQTVCRQLKLSSADLNCIERLKAAEGNSVSATQLRTQDDELRQTEQLAKEA